MSLTPAERARAYRARNRAGLGAIDRPGRPVLEPCGTMAAHRRHKRNGEPIDDACREEYNRWHREYQRARRSGR